MAQHIPIQNFKQKQFRIIEKAILKAMAYRYIKGSLKYIYDEDISKYSRLDESDEVFHTTRNIGPGFIWGTNTATFEIHKNKITNKVTNIFLVA